MAHKVNPDTCVSCGACVDECPVTAITMSDTCAVVDEQTCVDCGACEAVCPTDSIAEG